MEGVVWALRGGLLRARTARRLSACTARRCMCGSGTISIHAMAISLDEPKTLLLGCWRDRLAAWRSCLVEELTYVSSGAGVGDEGDFG